MSENKRWYLDMVAEPIIPAWRNSHPCEQNGADLERAILHGFGTIGDPILERAHVDSQFEMVFTFKEHGEFFRGALTLAGLRYPTDFYELLKRYGTIKVTINKLQKEPR